MALVGYQLPKSWVPDSEYINNPVGMEYLAWKLGENQEYDLWVFSATVDEPTLPIEELIPEIGEPLLLVKETNHYGYQRTILPALNMEQLEQAFNEQVESFK
jgi:hypothetical protein